jgi:hypothetical protein
VLMRDQQVAGQAVAAGLVERHRVQRLDVDEQRNLAQQRTLLAVGADAPSVLI